MKGKGHRLQRARSAIGLTIDTSSPGENDFDLTSASSLTSQTNTSQLIKVSQYKHSYMKKIKPLRRCQTFYQDGRLFNDQFSIGEQGLTINKVPSSLSLFSSVSCSSLLSEKDCGNLSDTISTSSCVQFMKVNKAEIQKKGLLGRGVSSAVYLGIERSTGKKMALKVIDEVICDPTKLDNLFNELEILVSTVSHPCLVSLYGAYLDHMDATLCLEYMDAGSLYDAIRMVKVIPEKELAAIAFQACTGLEFLHDSRKMLHRDIKPGNILLNLKGQVKLSDFGLAKVFDDNVENLSNVENATSFDELPEIKCKTFVGTCFYMSPERAKGEHYSFSSDVWSMGVTLAEVATGKYPLPKEASCYFDVIGNLESKPILPDTVSSPFYGELKISQQFHAMVCEACNLDVSKRLTAAELTTHAWIKAFDVSNLTQAVAITKAYFASL